MYQVYTFLGLQHLSISMHILFPLWTSSPGENLTKSTIFIACLSNISILASIVIFATLGNSAYELGVPVETVAKGGQVTRGNCNYWNLLEKFLTEIFASRGLHLLPTLRPFLICHAHSFGKISCAFPKPFVFTNHISSFPCRCIIFFLMLFLLGLDSEFALFETVLCAVFDAFPRLRFDCNRLKQALPFPVNIRLFYFPPLDVKKCLWPLHSSLYASCLACPASHRWPTSCRIFLVDTCSVISSDATLRGAFKTNFR